MEYGPALKYPFKGSGWIKKFFLGGLATFILPLSFGYVLRSYRSIIHGADDEIPDWKEPMDIFTQGIMGLLIVVAYMLPSLLLILIGYLLIGGGGLISSSGAISFLGMILSIFIVLGFLLLLFSLFIIPMALAFYVDSLEVRDAFQIRDIVKKIFDNIESYTWTVTFYIIISGTVLSVFFFILPLAVFYLQMFYAYIFGQIYIKAQN